MNKALAMTLLFLLVPALAFAHAGEVHSYMGTITALHEDGSFTIQKTDGTAMDVLVSKTTTYLHADGQAASAAELRAGSRVVVKVAKDGKTALSVKMAAAR
jgi:hypothetical protein